MEEYNPHVSPLKRVCSAHISSLEALPQDILLHVLCGVDHADLKQLFRVSKAIKKAMLIVKESYFNFSTPTSYKVEVETPNTPFIMKQPRDESKFNLEDFTAKRKKFNVKELNDISTALFCATYCNFSKRL